MLRLAVSRAPVRPRAQSPRRATTHGKKLLATYRRYYEALQSQDFAVVEALECRRIQLPPAGTGVRRVNTAEALLQRIPSPRHAVVVGTLRRRSWEGLYVLTGLAHPSHSTLHFIRFRTVDGRIRVGAATSAAVLARGPVEAQIAEARRIMRHDWRMRTWGRRKGVRLAVPPAAAAMPVGQPGPASTDTSPAARVPRILSAVEGAVGRFVAEMLGPTLDVGDHVQRQLSLPWKVAIASRLLDARIRDAALHRRGQELLGETLELVVMNERLAAGAAEDAERVRAWRASVFPNGAPDRRPVTPDAAGSSARLILDWETFNAAVVRYFD